MKLTTKARKAMPKEMFGEPGKRAYPMPDPTHAANAKARATQQVNAGKMAESTKAKIDAPRVICPRCMTALGAFF